jgi:hypothetical protein
MAPVPQVLVRTHPGSGRKSLFLSSHPGILEQSPPGVVFPDDARHGDFTLTKAAPVRGRRSNRRRATQNCCRLRR